MPRPRFHMLQPERRRQILEGAAEAFERSGLHGASLNRILSATGISKGVFYYYFDDKMDLYRTVVEAALQRFEAVFEEQPSVERLSAANFWGCLEASYGTLFAFSVENAAVVGLVKTISDLRPEEVEHLGIDARCLSWLQHYLRRGQALGVVRNDLPLALLMQLASAVDSTLGQWLFEDLSVGSETLEERTRTIVEMLRRVLGEEVQFPGH